MDEKCYTLSNYQLPYRDLECMCSLQLSSIWEDTFLLILRFLRSYFIQFVLCSILLSPQKGMVEGGQKTFVNFPP